MSELNKDYEVSVILPVYNAEKFLPELLPALINQNFVKYEIIVIDDCSKDKSVNIIKEFQIKYPDKIFLFQQDYNQGQGKARDLGLKYARGKYIMFVDSDDLVTKDFINTAYNTIEKYKADLVQLGYIYSNSRKFKDNLSQVGHSKNNVITYEIEHKRNGHDINILINQPLILKKIVEIINKEDLVIIFDLIGNSVWNKIFRREIIQNNNIQFINRIAEDTFFCYNYLRYCKRIIFIENKLYCYWKNPNSTMQEINCHLMQELIIKNDDIIKNIRSLNIDEKYVRKKLTSQKNDFLIWMEALSKKERINIFNNYNPLNGEFSNYIHTEYQLITKSYTMFQFKRLWKIGILKGIKLKLKKLMKK